MLCVIIETVNLCVLQAYWRSCAALLGHVLDGAFKDEFSVELLKLPEVPGTTEPFYSQLCVLLVIFR